jgi:zinc protease
LARLGVADLTADMLLRGGTSKRSALALAKEIDFVGGTLAANSTYEASILSCSVLARNASTCLSIIPDVVIKPAFSSQEMGAVWQGKIAEVRSRIDDAGQLASAHAQNLLWGNEHVRGWLPSETRLASITRDDLLTWHKTWFAPNNSILVVTGDFDVAKMKTSVQSAFASWKRSTIPPTPKYASPSLSGSKIRLVDKPGQTQTQIRIGQFGISHDDPVFFDSLVWNFVLGSGDFSSRLMKVVRVQGGKTYGASTSFDRNIDRGSIVTSTFTRNAEAIATAKLLLGEISKMASQGPTAAEVTKAISNIAGSYAIRFQSAADVGSAFLSAELHGFGREYVENYATRVGAVDAESSKRAAARVLDPKNFIMVLVGDAKDLEPQLKAAGWQYEKVSYTDAIGPELTLAPIIVDAKAQAAAKVILDGALAAKGGDKIRYLKSIRLTANGTTLISGQQAKVDISRTLVLPDKMRMDATLDLGQKVKIAIGLSGSVGWNQGPSGTLDIGDAERASIEFERWRDPELLLTRHLDGKTVIAPMSDEKIDGRGHATVRMTSPQGVNVTLYIDRASKMLTRVSFEEGGNISVDDFADYKSYDGVLIANKRVSTSAGRTTTLTITKVEINPVVDGAIFARPQ